MNKLLTIIIILVIGLGVIGVLTYNWNQTLKITEIVPEELELERFGDPEVKITFQNTGDEDIVNYNILVNGTNISEYFIDTHDISFNTKLTPKETDVTTIKPVKIYHTEGNELLYTLNLYLYVDDVFQEKYNLPLKIITTKSNSYYYSETNNDKSLVFTDLNTDTVKISENEEKTIDFNIKQEKNGAFENIRIISIIQNNNNGFISVDTLPIEKKFDFVGDKLENLSIPIKAQKSEGDQIKYFMQLVMLSNDKQLDTHTIEIILTS